jgi:hypothetical protein
MDRIYRIEITETGTLDELPDVLDRISELIQEGYTSGYDPDWDTTEVFDLAED